MQITENGNGTINLTVDNDELLMIRNTTRRAYDGAKNKNCSGAIRAIDMVAEMNDFLDYKRLRAKFELAGGVTELRSV